MVDTLSHDKLQETLKEKAVELFSLCDQQGKGYITEKDLTDITTELGLPLTRHQIQQAFLKLDDDKNGYLTLDEFTSGFGLFLGISPEEDLVDELREQGKNVTKGHELFYLCDPEGKGFITRKELERVASELNLNYEQLDLIFNKLDTDGNGCLTQDEFVMGFGNYLESESSEKPEDDIDNIQYEIDTEMHSPSDHNDNVFENVNPTNSGASEDPMFDDVVESIGEGIFSSTFTPDQLKDLWKALKGNETQGLRKFEDFLSKVSMEIRRSQQEAHQLENILKSKSTSHDVEVQHLYDEMEQQIRAERDSIQKQQEKREREMREELHAQLEGKEIELMRIIHKQNELEQKLQQVNEAEQNIKTENEKLLERNWLLEEQLHDSVSTLEDTRSYVQQLQQQTTNEKKERARTAVRVSEGLKKEQDSLVRQLDMLREMNQKLRDDRDTMAAAQQALEEKRGRTMSLSEELAEAEGNGNGDGESKHGKYKRQGSNMGKYIGSEDDQDAGKPRHKGRKKSSKRKKLAKQGSVLSNYFSGDMPVSTFGDLSPFDDVEFEGDVVMEEVDVKPSWTKMLVQGMNNANQENTSTEEQQEIEKFRSQKHNLGSDLMSDEGGLSTVSEASQTEGTSDEDVPPSPRVSPIGKASENRGIEKGMSVDMNPSTPERIFKVVFVGDSGVGKSSFIHRLCHDEWKSSFTATIGVDFQMKSLFLDDHFIALQLWDTAGQERFRSITKQYFRKADGVIVMFDVMSESSFLNVKSWMLSVEDGAEHNVSVMILGNKTDLAEEKGSRAVPEKNGKKLAEDYKALYLETSSKSGHGISDAIIMLSRRLREQEDAELQSVLDLNLHTGKKSKCCGKT